MSKYEVTIKSIEIYIIPSVEAASESEAIEEACGMLESNENKNKFHHDSDGTESAIDVDLL